MPSVNNRETHFLSYNPRMDYHVFVITVALILGDLATGLCGAIKSKDLDSTKLRDGLWHKMGFILLIAFAYALEYAAGYIDIGIDVPAVGAVCAYIMLTEGVSITENLCIINPEIAQSPVGAIFKHDAKVQGAESWERDDND
ncbi:holin [Eggerthellaceae bacterium zg-893]|nr:holin [Eggerthellaceae bacterium zg-893]